MTQEDKELLLQDLCARLSYGVYISPADCGKAILIGVKNGKPLLLDTILKKEYDKPWDIEYIKPYLRPISSMTEEEKEEYCNLQDKFLYSSQYPVTDAYELFDWLNEHHFDYRNLVERGLAIAVTEENNPYKE